MAFQQSHGRPPRPRPKIASVAFNWSLVLLLGLHAATQPYLNRVILSSAKSWRREPVVSRYRLLSKDNGKPRSRGFRGGHNGN